VYAGESRSTLYCACIYCRALGKEKKYNVENMRRVGEMGESDVQWKARRMVKQGERERKPSGS